MGNPNTKLEPVHGYRVLDPLPTREELDQFYQVEYYDMI